MRKGARLNDNQQTKIQTDAPTLVVIHARKRFCSPASVSMAPRKGPNRGRIYDFLGSFACVLLEYCAGRIMTTAHEWGYHPRGAQCILCGTIREVRAARHVDGPIIEAMGAIDKVHILYLHTDTRDGRKVRTSDVCPPPRVRELSHVHFDSVGVIPLELSLDPACRFRDAPRLVGHEPDPRYTLGHIKSATLMPGSYVSVEVEAEAVKAEYDRILIAAKEEFSKPRKRRTSTRARTSKKRGEK